MYKQMSMQNMGEIDGVQVYLTWHALQRMVEMDMKPEEIKLLITNPEQVYNGVKHASSLCHRRGRFSIAMEEKDGVWVIKTALYANMDEWKKAAERGELAADRPLRLDVGIY